MKKDGGKQVREGGAARMMENQRVGMKEEGEREGDSARERTPRKCEHFGL